MTALNGQNVHESKFVRLLEEQIRHEFNAHQQYVALAVWCDGMDLPRLAAHFYRQALEERNHAMMIVQYLLDQDIEVVVPGSDAPRGHFSVPVDAVKLALEQEREVSRQIVTLVKAARDESDFIGEQFMQWFLKEQVEEVSQMSTLLTVVERAGDNYFEIENFLAREAVGDDSATGAPPVAGGSV